MKTNHHGLMDMARVFAAILGVFFLYGTHAHAAFPVGSNSFLSATNVTETNGTSIIFDLSTYSAEANEPGISGFAPYKSAWWRWTAPADGQLLVQAQTLPDVVLVPPTAQPLIGVYEGTTVGNLIPLGQAATVFDPTLPFASYSPRVSIPVRIGQQVRIKIDANNLTTVGNVFLSLRFFAAGARTYQGAITLGYGTGEQAGITLSVTSAGRFTGKLTVPGGSFPFSGSVNAQFRAEIGMPNAPLSHPVTLSIDLANGTGPLPIALYDSNDGESGFLYPIGKFSTLPPPVSGMYNAVLDTGRNGYLTGKISPRGRCTFAGVTGDGTKFTFGGALVDVGIGVYGLPFCRSISGDKGFIAGGLRFTEGGIDILDAMGFENRYKRPPGTGGFLPAGVQTTFTVAGRAYTRPAQGQRALGFLNQLGGTGKLTVSAVNGEIAGFTENLLLSSANKFSFTSPTRKPVLKLNTKTGVVTGTIEEPVGFKRKLRGILSGSPLPVLKGFVTGTSTTANFQITAL